jgi:hypothetical protein
MYQRLALAALLLCPALSWAQAPQETALPAQSQLYLRFDGMKAHRNAYEQTVAGKLMQGELGTFLKELGKYAVDLLQRAAQNQPEAGPWIDDAVGLIGVLYQNGLSLGVEVQQVNPPTAHGVLVFPKAGGEGGTLLPLLQKVAEAGKVEVKDIKVGKRFVHQVQGAPVMIGWWAEADDVDGGKTGLDKHPLYRKVRDFKAFTTASRGYVDIGALVRVVADIAPPAREIVDELGISALGSVTFVTGFDGPAQRSVTELEAPSPRKGLMTMGSRKTVRLQDLPPLPSDLTTVSAGTMDIGKSYEVLLQLVQTGVKIFAPAQEETAKEAVKTIEALLGVNLKADLFDQFGQVYVLYNSPSESLLGFSPTTAVQVKDGKKIVDALERMTKAAGFIPGLELSWTKREYKGGQLLDLQFKFNEASSHVATLGLYRDWLVFAGYPQPIKGFILRGNRELPAWQTEPKLAKVLAQFPAEYSSISISDPRPTIEALLTAAPFLLNLINTVSVQALPGMRSFDIGLIPHAQETTRSLFPSVSVTTDDGRTVRIETRSSFP